MATLRNAGPTFGGSTSTPALASSGPTAEIPTPTAEPPERAAAAEATARSRSMHAATTASGPSAPGVSVSPRATTTPCGVTSAARIRLAPRSRARTLPGATGRFGPPRALVDGAMLTPRILAARRGGANKTRPPPVARRGPGSSRERAVSAADLEDLAAALGACPLKCRLAVLHRDPLCVLDFDFLLVLDAIGLGHVGLPPRSVRRHENPRPALA